MMVTMAMMWTKEFDACALESHDDREAEERREKAGKTFPFSACMEVHDELIQRSCMQKFVSELIG